MSLFDLVPERFHLASDDYEELWDAILDHPSPEKALDGDPYLHYRPQYRVKRTASAGTELSSSTTGDSWQGHADIGAVPGSPPSVDFIPFEPGTLCSFCSQNQAECTVNGSNLCLDCAQNHWGIPMDRASTTPGVPGEAPQMPQEPTEDLAEGSGALDPHEAMSQYQGDHFFIFHKANPREMGGVPYHTMEAWETDHPNAHVHPSDRNSSYAGEDSWVGGSGPHPIGSVEWSHQSGEVHNVFVHPDFQRQGLATELWDRAKDVGANTRGVKVPRHSRDRTNEGDVWARSLRERLPKRYVHEAAWRDVMDKAKRMRAENAVHLLEVPSPTSPYVFAEVKGDTALHHCFVAVKGEEQGQWSCSCNWGDFGPNGPLAEDRSAGSPYKKTPCSHILATRWELQSRSMFGRNPYTGALHTSAKWEYTSFGDVPRGPHLVHRLVHETEYQAAKKNGFFQSSEAGGVEKGPNNFYGTNRLFASSNPEPFWAADEGKSRMLTFDKHKSGWQLGQGYTEDEEREAGRNSDRPVSYVHYGRIPFDHVVHATEPMSKDEISRSRRISSLNEKEGAMATDVLDDWFAGRFLHEAKEGPAEAEQDQGYGHLQGWLAPHRNPEGTEWKGKTPGAYGRNPRATHWDDLDEGTQKKVSGTIHKALGEAPTIPNASVPGGSKNPMPAKSYQAPKNQGDLVNNITNMFHSARNSDDKGEGKAYLTNGARWYKDAHNQVKDWAHTYGIDHYHMNGATAALSPSTDWDSNLTMAHYHARHLGTKNADGTENNQTFRIDRGHKSYAKDVSAAAKDGVDLDGLENKRFRDMTHAEAYHAVKHQALRVDKIKRSSGGPMVENPRWGPSWQSSKNGVRAIRMMRGETEADSPDKLLSGHKVRSFHNNLYHAGHTDDVTVDSHATSLAMGAKMGASSKTLKKVLEFGNTGREKAQNSRGGYSYIADSYRQAHANLVRDGHMSKDSTPADLQAITWKRWRDLMPSRSAGKKGHESTEHTQKNSFPVLAALDHDEDEEHYDDEEHWLDPWGGPDEPDPDLHAQEEDGWEGSEDEPEDDEDHDEDEEDHGDHDEAEDYSDMVTDRRKEGAMFDWTTMLRQARREALAAEVPPPPEVPVQYLSQVPHHLASGMDEFGFEHQANGVPSEQWQTQHSPGAKNPASTAPAGFGDPLDPADQKDVLGSGYPDEQMLEPGPVLTNRFRGPATNAGYDVVIGAYQGPSQGGGGGSYIQAPLNPEPPYPMVQAPSSQPVSLPPVPEEPTGASQVLSEHQAGLEWLRPHGSGSDGQPGASPAMSRAAATQDNMNLAAGADAFLRTGSIPVPGMEVNMDTILALPSGSLGGMSHDARSRDFTPAEQDEMVREGELEGVRASNLHMLRLQGSMYEELERQLSTEDQSEASANALWW